MQNKNEYPLISIALCTYNGEKFLREQLDSLVYQTYPNIEIVAVDDCSTDKTLDILEEYAARYEYFYLYENTKNIGLSRNFEKAILLCKGEYIAISDQDDVWHLNKIEFLKNQIQDELLIYAKSELINTEGALLREASNKKLYSGSDIRTMTFVNYTWGHNVFFRRSLVDLAFPLPEGTDYDWQLGLAALNYGHIRFIDNTLVKHRRHTSNATLRLHKNKYQKRAELNLRIKNILLFENLKEKAFFERLSYWLDRLDNLFFRIRLKIFILHYREILFYNSGKSYFSLLNKVRKML